MLWPVPGLDVDMDIDPDLELGRELPRELPRELRELGLDEPGKKATGMASAAKLTREGGRFVLPGRFMLLPGRGAGG